MTKGRITSISKTHQVCSGLFYLFLLLFFSRTQSLNLNIDQQVVSTVVDSSGLSFAAPVGPTVTSAKDLKEPDGSSNRTLEQHSSHELNSGEETTVPNIENYRCSHDGDESSDVENNLSNSRSISPVNRQKTFPPIDQPRKHSPSPEAQMYEQIEQKQHRVSNNQSPAVGILPIDEICQEDPYIEEMVKGHAIRMFDEYRLADLGRFAAHLDFQIVPWLKKNPPASATFVDDPIVAIHRLHQDFDWPYPSPLVHNIPQNLQSHLQRVPPRPNSNATDSTPTYSNSTLNKPMEELSIVSLQEAHLSSMHSLRDGSSTVGFSESFSDFDANSNTVGVMDHGDVDDFNMPANQIVLEETVIGSPRMQMQLR